MLAKCSFKAKSRVKEPFRELVFRIHAVICFQTFSARIRASKTNWRLKENLNSDDWQHFTLRIKDLKQVLSSIVITDRYVLLGSPRPSSGTAVLMEVARILLSMRKKGTKIKIH